MEDDFIQPSICLVFFSTAVSTKHIFAATKKNTHNFRDFLKNPSTHQQLALGGFYPPAFLPLVLGFVVTSVETVGDIQATCDVSGLPLEGPDADSRIQGGRGEGECRAMFGWRYVKPFLLELSGR